MKSMERAGLHVEGQKMEVLGRLTSSVIHDLNNLLTVIGLNAELLEEGSLSKEESVSCSQKILEASRYSSELTRKVLNFARSRPQEPESMQPNELIDGMLRMLSPLVARKVSVSFQPECAGWIHGDRSAIEVAVMNLVLNAVDAMPDGGAIAISTMERTDDGGTFVEICVEDQGEGIDPEIGERIFEPFFTTKVDGTGMGLSIVSRVAESHGGRIEFQSKPGEGAVFRLRIPEVEAPGEGLDVEEGKPSGLADSRRRRAVLLVEDDEAIRMLTRQQLARYFDRVLDVPSAEEALGVWRSERESIDLLLTDVILPGKSGWELAKAIRAEAPTLPVLYMSGYGNFGEDRSVLAKSGFLPKPFPAEALKQAIAGVLSAR